jgi:hypothetical protein
VPGISNYLLNKLHDFLHRAQSFTPPATVYLTLCSTAPNVLSPGVELSGAGYARVAYAQSLTSVSGTQGAGTTAVSTGTSGVVSNNISLNFGTAGSAWGTASHWETYDAATGGNRLEFGLLKDASGAPAPITILSGNPVSIPPSNFAIKIF